MSRKTLVVCVIVLSASYTQIATAQVPVLSVGVKSSGVMPVNGPRRGGFRNRVSQTESFYSAEYTLALKAGQEIFITAEILGTGRSVKIEVDDPAGAPAYREAEMAPKAMTIHLPQVGASGKYRVFVMSDQIGNFSLRATDKPAEMDEAALREKIERLEKELKAAKEELEAVLSSKS
jgi:hypothetical protein